VPPSLDPPVYCKTLLGNYQFSLLRMAISLGLAFYLRSLPHFWHYYLRSKTWREGGGWLTTAYHGNVIY